MTFINYVVEEIVPKVIDNNEIMTIIDAFAENKKITKCKHDLGISTNFIKNIYKQNRVVERFVVKFMNGQVIKTPAEYTEGELTKEATYYPKSSTLNALKNAVKTKFSTKSEVIMDYITEKIVKYSNGLGNNTFSNFNSYFGGN